MIPAEVQHGKQAWPRLAPGRLLGMGLVFLKFFYLLEEETNGEISTWELILCRTARGLYRQNVSRSDAHVIGNVFLLITTPGFISALENLALKILMETAPFHTDIGLANIVYWVFHAIELTDEYRDDCCTDTVDDEAFTREVLARADKGGAITNGHDHVDMPIRLLCFGEGWWLGLVNTRIFAKSLLIRWLQNHVGFIEENGLVHGVQHGERAWPRLAPGRLLGMGLVFLKFFLSFGRGDKWRDQHLGAHRLPNDKVILAEVVEPFYRCALSDVIGHSLAFLGPGGALFSTGCTVRTFREVMLVSLAMCSY
ncbi:unnamed protein product [Prunus armeniaca]